VNITNTQQGAVAYVHTKYRGKEEHSGKYHANLCEDALQDGSRYRVAVADNTGNMVMMFKLLQIAFIYFIGCYIDVMVLFSLF